MKVGVFEIEGTVLCKKFLKLSKNGPSCIDTLKYGINALRFGKI